MLFQARRGGCFAHGNRGRHRRRLHLDFVPIHAQDAPQITVQPNTLGDHEQGVAGVRLAGVSRTLNGHRRRGADDLHLAAPQVGRARGRRSDLDGREPRSRGWHGARPLSTGPDVRGCGIASRRRRRATQKYAIPHSRHLGGETDDASMCANRRRRGGDAHSCSFDDAVTHGFFEQSDERRSNGHESRRHRRRHAHHSVRIH